MITQTNLTSLIKSNNLYLFSFIIISLFTFESCSIQKRHYRSGYYVNWEKKHPAIIKNINIDSLPVQVLNESMGGTKGSIISETIVLRDSTEKIKENIIAVIGKSDKSVPVKSIHKKQTSFINPINDLDEFNPLSNKNRQISNPHFIRYQPSYLLAGKSSDSDILIESDSIFGSLLIIFIVAVAIALLCIILQIIALFLPFIYFEIALILFITPIISVIVYVLYKRLSN